MFAVKHHHQPRRSDFYIAHTTATHSKDIFVYWDVGRSDQVLVNKTSSTGSIGTTQQRYRNATFHFRKVEDWRGKY